MGYSRDYKELTQILNRKVKEYYDDRLISFIVFGSVARGAHRPDSDIDCLIIANNLPKGRLMRVSEFEIYIENTLESFLKVLNKKSIYPTLSPIFKSKEEVLNGSPLFLDMVHDVTIYYDRDNFFNQYLDRLKSRLDKLGSRRIRRGNAWYWILKPDYKYGEVIEL